MMNQSMLHLYSMGIVAANKVMSSNEALVTPIEVLPMLDGEIASNPTNQTIQGVDASGRNYTVSVIHDNALVCEWLDVSGSNRSTAPDVRRGERVKIWRYGDTDKFYWSSTGDNTTRKLETVRHTFSGTSDESVTELDETNSYYHEVSTHQGTTTYSTSKANGEMVAYHVQFDGKNGIMHIQDDMGNVLEMDSSNHRISVTNSDGTQYRADGQNLAIFAKDTVAINAQKTFSLETQDLQVKCQTMELNVSDNVQATITNKATVNCPEVEFSGHVKMGSFETTGAGEISGQTTFNGPVTANEGLSSPNVPIHGPTQTLN